jgi:hypothetical protein
MTIRRREAGHSLVEYLLMMTAAFLVAFVLTPQVAMALSAIYTKVVLAMGSAYTADAVAQVPVTDSEPMARIVCTILAILCLGLLVLRRKKNSE